MNEQDFIAEFNSIFKLRIIARAIVTEVELIYSKVLSCDVNFINEAVSFFT